MVYRISEEGLRTLARLPKNIQRRILDKLDFIFAQSNPLTFTKKLNGFEYGDYRIRIGEYRTSFDLKNNIAKFLKFGHRKDFYK